MRAPQGGFRYNGPMVGWRAGKTVLPARRGTLLGAYGTSKMRAEAGMRIDAEQGARRGRYGGLVAASLPFLAVLLTGSPARAEETPSDKATTDPVAERASLDTISRWPAGKKVVVV